MNLYLSLLIIGFIILTCSLIISYYKKRIINNLNNNISESEMNLILQKELNQYINSENSNLKTQVTDLQNKVELLQINIAKKESDNNFLEIKIFEQKREIEEIQKRLTSEFENIANKILKQNSIDFTFANQKNISEILNPLKEKIQLFEQKINETQIQGVKDNTSLREEVKKLYELNNRISIEANNLTQALKGDTKKQGNWGEVVLERILERSGLIKGEEYEIQFSTRNEENTILRPDVVIKLPDNKHIIIDSKVSLNAYEKLVNAENNEEKEHFSKLHIDSLKNHVKGLSEKNYSNAVGINSPDFVLMFLPIESSFSIAIQKDIELFNFAWDRRVVIVSPSTLLATLKTIESIWKRAKQTQNALEIANEGGKLYDKFCGLVEDLKKLGNQLETVNKTYLEANKKLYNGSGNIINKVEKLKNLGAKNTKSLHYNNYEKNMQDEDCN